MGSAAFFAPLTRTVPRSGVPPTMRMLSIAEAGIAPAMTGQASGHEERSRERPLGMRAHVRGALVAVAILVNLLEGCPLPRASRANLATPVNQAELQRWSALLGDVGVERTPEELADQVLDASESTARVHGQLLAPFAWYFHLTATTQRWSLFPIADTHPVRISIEALCGADWEVLYRPFDESARFEADRLEYRRVRGAWNPSIRGPRAAYPTFVDWLASRIARARPDCTEMRVHYEEMSLPPPGEGEIRYGTFVWEARRALARRGDSR